ncbi:MAG: S8 family serine peptidase [Steroidobacteraceae bacterium]
MASRFLAIGALAVLGAVTASSAVGPPHFNALQPKLTAGNAHLYVVGSRSAAQRRSASSAKLDPVLADLSRHAGLARPDRLLADLHSLSPAARFKKAPATGAPLVLIDATTRGDVQQLKSALARLGLVHAAVYLNDVGGWLPVEQLEAAAGRAEVLSVRAAMPRTRAGAVTSQGDFAQRSSVVRTDFPALDGTGITVGVLSDSFNCYAVYAQPGSGVPVSGNQGYAPNGFTADYATDVSTGALPANVNVLAEADCPNYGAPDQTPDSDEGRAMLQIVHDVAPGAGLAFYTGDNSEADFANGIGALAAAPPTGAGAKVIADDLSYFDEPYFQDGILAQAIDTVEGEGVAYFSAAGNNGTLTYQNTAPSFATVSTSAPTAGEHLLNFDTTGATDTTSLPVTVPPIPPGDFLAIVVQWDQPYVTGAPGSPGATSSVDLCVTGASGVTITDYDGNAVSCTGPNAVGVDPYQILIIGNPANAAGNTARQSLNLTVGLAANANGTPVPGRILVSVEDDGLGSTIDAFWSGGPTIQGHPGAAGAAAVGAAFYFDTPQCGTSPATLESYSSAGGAPILFNALAAGARYATPIVRQKPDFVGPDGGNDTFLGFTLASVDYPGSTKGLLNTTISACQNVPSYPNFFGTSAATPHAAGIAALMLTANGSVKPAQIYGSLHDSALPMGSPVPNFNSGYGFIQADSALVVPTLTLSAPSIPLGGSAVLSWSSIYATSCTASGSWSGAQTSSGSITLTPTAAGATTYTLTCINAGASAAGSVTLTTTSGTAPAAPTLSLASNSVEVGQSTTLAWSSVGATSCTASGSWSGTQAPSGTRTVTPTAIGIETFTLICSNAGGTSAPASVALTATPALTAPAAPVLTLGATSIAAYTTTSLTWSSSRATSCLASGTANSILSGWTGTLGPSGTVSLTPTASGASTYSLTCSNAVGKSAASSVTLNVTPSTNTGGSGTLDEFMLIGLGALALARRRRA